MNHRLSICAGLALTLGLLFLAGCSTAPRVVNRPVSHALTGPVDNRLSEALARDAAEHPGLSGFHLLSHNLDAFAARVVLSRVADQTLDVQYYLFHSDDTGAYIGHELLSAADRGVRVRLLIDDMATSGRDANIAVLDSHPNIEIRLFNPFPTRGWARFVDFITRPGRVGRRMHNKSFIVDNMAAIIGGRNIGDEYFSARTDYLFADIDVLALGPVVPEVSASFDDYWNSEWATPVTALTSYRPAPGKLDQVRRLYADHAARMESSVYGEAVAESDLLQGLDDHRLPLHWAGARLFADRPAKVDPDRDGQNPGGEGLRPLVEDGKEELLLISPYFVPGRDGVALFKRLRKRGMRVEVLTNSLAANDVWIVHSGYVGYRAKLLRLGVGLFEIKPRAFDAERRELTDNPEKYRIRLHAKTFVLDRSRVFIGSANMDPRSRNLNTEIGLMIDSPGLSAEVVDIFREVTGPQNSYRLALTPTDPGNTLSTPDEVVWITERDGRQEVLRGEPEAGLLLPLAVGLMQILPIEGQL